MEKINSKSDRYSLMKRIFLSLAIKSPPNMRFFRRWKGNVQKEICHACYEARKGGPMKEKS